jgi:hypothetical protein
MTLPGEDAMRRRHWNAVGFTIIIVCIFIAVNQARIDDRKTANQPETIQQPAAPATTVTPSPPAVGDYVGNTNTHRFHRRSCRYASCPNCTVTFETRREALDAGFRPGGCCNP